MMGAYSNHALDLYFSGWVPLPIVPGQKGCTEPNWASRDIDSATVDQWVADRTEHGAGLRTGFVRAVDIDIRDPELSLEMSSLMQERCPGPLVRVGQAPKTLLTYRLADDSVLLGKRWSNKYRSPDGLEHGIEVLGAGQQFVSFGIHPDTQRPYEWVGRSPLDVSPDELPPLDEEAVDDLIDAFERQCEARGWEVVSVAGRGMDMDPRWDEDERYLVSYRRKSGLPLSRIDQMLYQVDMDARADWLRVGFGLHFETDGSAEGLALWQAHSWEGAHADCERVWHSMGRKPEDLLGPPATVFSALPADLIDATLREMEQDNETLDLLGDPQGAEPETPQPSDEYRGDLYLEGDFLEPGDPPDQLLEDILVQGESSLMSAQPNTGKSALALDMGAHVAAGVRWNGKEVEQGGVIYVAAESPETIKARYVALRQSRPDLASRDLAVVRRRVDLSTPEGRKDFATRIKAYRDHLDSPLRLVVIDTFRNASGGADENDAKEVKPIMAFLHEAGRRLNAHMLVVHHTTKSGTSYSGSGAFGAICDTEMVVQEGEKEHEGLVQMYLKQQRSLSTKGQAFWYRIKSHPTGRINNFGKVETAPLIHCVADDELGSLVQGNREKRATEIADQVQRDALVVAHATVEGCSSLKKIRASTSLPYDRIKAARDWGVEKGLFQVVGEGNGARYLVKKEVLDGLEWGS